MVTHCHCWEIHLCKYESYGFSTKYGFLLNSLSTVVLLTVVVEVVVEFQLAIQLVRDQQVLIWHIMEYCIPER